MYNKIPYSEIKFPGHENEPVIMDPATAKDFAQWILKVVGGVNQETLTFFHRQTDFANYTREGKFRFRHPNHYRNLIDVDTGLVISMARSILA